MRTNIDIDDAVLDAVMKAGQLETKKEAVEAGLKLVAGQAVCRELLALQGKLHRDGDSDATAESAQRKRGLAAAAKRPARRRVAP